MLHRVMTETATNDAAAAATPPAEPARAPGEGTPEGDKLKDAHAAFDAGDYRRVRALCDELARASDAEVVRAAVALRRRTEVDPVQIGVLVACLVFFAIIVYVYVVP